MAPQHIRFGIIGGSGAGRRFAIAAARWGVLRDLDVVPELRGLCDADPAVRAWYASNLPAVALRTDSYADLLESDTIDAIYCAIADLPLDALCDACLAAGKHLLIEQLPLGDAQMGQRIAALSAQRPASLVRISSPFPFYPGAQQIAQAVQGGGLGQITQVRAGLLYADEPARRAPGCLSQPNAPAPGAEPCADLSIHLLHLPLRLGWLPHTIRAIPASRIGAAHAGPCDDLFLLAEAQSAAGAQIPMSLELKRLAPGNPDIWYLHISGTQAALAFSTRQPHTLMQYRPGDSPGWQGSELEPQGVYRTCAAPLAGFGPHEASVQMWAAFMDEAVHRERMLQPFRCALPEEVAIGQRLLAAALDSADARTVVDVWADHSQRAAFSAT